MHAVGPDEGPPLAMPGQQQYDQASTRAAAAVVAVLAGGADSQSIDIAAHEVGTWQYHAIQRYAVSGRIMTRATNFGPPPGGVWECRDGYVDIAAHSEHHWDAFVDVLGHPDDLSEPLYRERSMRAQLFDLLTPIIADHMRQLSAPELVERAQAAGLPCALRYRPDEVLGDEQMDSAASDRRDLPPRAGRDPAPSPGDPNRSTAVRLPEAVARAGSANHEIYIDELGHDSSDLAEWRNRGLI